MRVWCALIWAFSSMHAAVCPVLVGIAGGSGSGKTTWAHRLQSVLGDEVEVLSEDAYYKDFSHLSLEERAQVNYDSPQSIDFALLGQHLAELKQGHSIPRLEYDFVHHGRIQGDGVIEPRSIMILEGILALADPDVRELFDIKLYVDTDEDIRLLRRIERDMKERGRTFMSIRDQYLKTVKPMYDAFIAPSKQYADLIIPGTGTPTVALDTVASRLKHMTGDVGP